MERAILLALALFASAPLVGCLEGEEDDSSSSSGGGGPPPPPPPPPGGDDGMDGPTITYPGGHPLNWLSTDPIVFANEDEINTLVNNHRVSIGLNSLVHDVTMRRCARGHSRHMRGDVHDFFAHQNPEGDMPWDRMTANGISWTSAGENIAAGYATAQSAFDGWMASPGHRANIESSSWSRTGIGYQDGAPGDPTYITYWTQIFAN